MLLADDERKLQNFHHGRDITNVILRKVMEADCWRYEKKFVNSCCLSLLMTYDGFVSIKRSYLLLLSSLKFKML